MNPIYGDLLDQRTDAVWPVPDHPEKNYEKLPQTKDACRPGLAPRCGPPLKECGWVSGSPEEAEAPGSGPAQAPREEASSGHLRPLPGLVLRGPPALPAICLEHLVFRCEPHTGAFKLKCAVTLPPTLAFVTPPDCPLCAGRTVRGGRLAASPGHRQGCPETLQPLAGPASGLAVPSTGVCGQVSREGRGLSRVTADCSLMFSLPSWAEQVANVWLLQERRRPLGFPVSY